MYLIALDILRALQQGIEMAGGTTSKTYFDHVMEQSFFLPALGFPWCGR